MHSRHLTIVIAVALAVLVATGAGISYWISSNPGHNQAVGPCTLAPLQSSWHYWVVYYTTNGTVLVASGGSSEQVQSTNLSPEEAVLNVTNLTLMHSVMCSAEAGQLSDWYVNTSTHQLERE
jgi:flagellar basal body-associated protein FliL